MSLNPRCPIELWQVRAPKKTALFGPGFSLSFAELDLAVTKRTKELIESPLLPLIPRPDLVSIVTLFAAWRSAIPVYLLSRELPPSVRKERKERAFAIGQSGAKMATLIETSGSTGSPKIVCHSSESLMIGAKSGAKALKLGPDSIYGLNLPLHHISGIMTLLRAFYAGSSVSLPGASPTPTHLSIVPTQLYRMLSRPGSLPPYQCLLLGGGHCPPHLFAEGQKRGLPLYTTYGMTESGAMATLRLPDDPLLHAGKTLPHIECQIDPTGEILLRGGSLFSHYLGEAERGREEWFRTKDLGVLSPEGNLTIIGRKDRQFKSGGENIQPEEIERILLSHPQILQAKVYPVADPELGFRPKAEIYALEKGSIQEIEEYLRERLHRWKVPKEISLSCCLQPFKSR